jgi:hypothetical protein
MPGQWPLDASIHDPLAALEAPERTSFFTTVGKFAAAVSNITNLFALPLRIAQRFLHQQHIRADPIRRADGARKKRLVDAGLAETPVTPNRSRSVRTRTDNTMQQAESLDVILSQSPGGWPMEPLLEQPFATVPATFEKSYADWTPLPASQLNQSFHSYNGSDIDDSLDFSFSDSDILTSTPPVNPKTGSPMQQSWDSPEPASPSPRSSLGIPESSRATPCPPDQHVHAMRPLNHLNKRMLNVKRSSPNSQQRNLKNAPVTPMRRQLLKQQLRATNPAMCSPPTQHANHTMPSQSPRTKTPSTVQEQAINASVLRTNAPDVSKNAQRMNELYKVQSQAREIGVAEAQATRDQAAEEHDGLDPVITTTDELSFLLDADSSFNYINDLSELPDAPSPQRKSVRWAKQSGVKPFYFDERVSEMLDSTLETIASPTKRRSRTKKHKQDDNVSYRDTVDDSALSDDSSADGPSLRQLGTSPESVGSRGVPANTWDSDDDSLGQLELSQELIDDLEAEVLKKLSLAPPPPPEKPLVAPLTDDEEEQLKEAASKTDHGRNESASVVPDKLNARDFGTLLPDRFNGSAKAWLNDEIVNEYLSILVSHKKQTAGFVKKSGGPAPPVHAFSSHFFTSAAKGVKSVDRWAGRVQLKGAQYLDADLILYPICDQSHWRLLAVKPKERVIEYLDSLGWGGDRYVGVIRTYLKQELGDLYVEDEWVVVKKQRSSKQLNGSDCGVFTLLNALVLLRGDDTKKVISSHGMSEARERIAITLMAGRPTTEMD